MTYFDENTPYWGNTTKPLMEAGKGRLMARSVKIFADGIHLISQYLTSAHLRLIGALRTGGAAVINYLSLVHICTDNIPTLH